MVSADLDSGKTNAPAPGEKVLNAAVFRSFKVLKVTRVSYNTKIIRLEIPFGRSLGLPIGRHVSVRATLPDGTRAVRAYTPTSRPSQHGYFDLMVKTYEAGKLSPVLHELRPGQSVEVRGPVGRFKYHPNQYLRIGLVAAGTGLTPCLQLIRCVLEGADESGERGEQPHEKDRTCLRLLYQNRTEADILLRDELDALAKRFPGRLSITYFLSNAEESSSFGQDSQQQVTNRGKKAGDGAGQGQGQPQERRGYIQQGDVHELLRPADCPLVCLCGPAGFNSCITDKLVQEGHVAPAPSAQAGGTAAAASIYVW